MSLHNVLCISYDKYKLVMNILWTRSKSVWIDPYFFSWFCILSKLLCISYVLVMIMITGLCTSLELWTIMVELWSNYGHYRPLSTIMKCFSKKHITKT